MAKRQSGYEDAGVAARRGWERKAQTPGWPADRAEERTAAGLASKTTSPGSRPAELNK